MKNELVDRKWIARWIRLSLSTVDACIVPHLRGYRIGRRVLFKHVDVLTWFYNGMTKPPGTQSLKEFLSDG